jgi:hypothetical protein
MRRALLAVSREIIDPADIAADGAGGKRLKNMPIR